MNWSRISAAMHRRLRLPFTRGGWLFIVTMLLVGVSAMISANNLLFLVLAAMLAAFMVAGLISRLVLAALELELLLPENISARRKVPARLKLRNLKFWMPSFSIHLAGVKDPNAGDLPPILTEPLYFPVIPGGATLEENVEVVFPRRGEHSHNLFAFSTRFPFGFSEKITLVTLRRETLVYPSIEPQPGFEGLLDAIIGDIETNYRGIGSDFYRLRPYEAFESARHVDWKSTAHTGELQVREFLREQQRSVEIFLDRNIPYGLDPWFEYAVECCAFLAWNLSQEDAGLRFRSQRFDVQLPETGDVYTILKFLALVEPLSGKFSEAPTDDSSFQVVFTPSPDRFREAGWTDARILGPDAFPGVSLRTVGPVPASASPT